MKKKLISLVALTMFASLLTLGGVNSSELHTTPTLEETTLLKEQKGTALANVRRAGEEVATYSDMYVQYAKHTGEDGVLRHYIRFAMAFKNVNYIKFERHIHGLESTDGFINTVYSSISSEGTTYYYTDEGLTTTAPTGEAEYYWATYTISIVDTEAGGTFDLTKDITLNMYVDNNATPVSRTTSAQKEAEMISRGYTILVAPSLTESGLLLHTDGTTEEVPPLTDSVYKKGDENGYATYTHSVHWFKIFVEITSGQFIGVGSGKINDVTLHTTTLPEGLSISYNKSSDTFTLEVEEGKEVSLTKMQFDGASAATPVGRLEFKGAGTFNINSNEVAFFAVESVTVHNGTTLNLTTNGSAIHSVGAFHVKSGATVNATGNHGCQDTKLIDVENGGKLNITSINNDGLYNCGEITIGDEATFTVTSKGAGLACSKLSVGKNAIVNIASSNSVGMNNVTELNVGEGTEFIVTSSSTALQNCKTLEFGKNTIVNIASSNSVGVYNSDSLTINDGAVVTIDSASAAITSAKDISILAGSTLNVLGGASGDCIQFEKNNFTFNLFGTLNIASGSLDENGKSTGKANSAVLLNTAGTVNMSETTRYTNNFALLEGSTWYYDMPSEYVGYRYLFCATQKVTYTGAELVSAQNDNPNFFEFQTADGTVLATGGMISNKDNFTKAN